MILPDSLISRPRLDPELPASIDPLAESLRLLKLTGVLYCRAELSAPWGIELPALPGCMMIHIVNAGRCQLEIRGREALPLDAGSLALLPHGTDHRIRSNPGAPAEALSDIPIQLVSDRYEIMQYGGGGDATHITYCGVRFDHASAQRLLQLLPEVVHVNTRDLEDDWLHDTVRFISREAAEMRPGGETIITRLADIVVIQAIRAWLDTAPATDQGWLAALRDRHIGRALGAIHRHPSARWSVESLARHVGMSRSGFAARFTHLVGEPAMQYVTGWRLQLACSQLEETEDSLAHLAERYGYQSEAAFSRAFKRRFGESPGRYRRLSKSVDGG